MTRETMLAVARQAISNAFRYDTDRDAALRWFDEAVTAGDKLASQAVEIERLTTENERLSAMQATEDRPARTVRR